MPRPSHKPDLLTLFVDRLAQAVARELQHAPRVAGPRRRGRPATKDNAARRKGQKRPPAVMAKTTEALLAYIKGHGGERIEQIAKAMKRPTKDLALPAKKLLGEKKIKTKGVKRGTRYFAA